MKKENHLNSIKMWNRLGEWNYYVILFGRYLFCCAKKRKKILQGFELNSHENMLALLKLIFLTYSFYFANIPAVCDFLWPNVWSVLVAFARQIFMCNIRRTIDIWEMKMFLSSNVKYTHMVGDEKRSTMR
jgi:hypothetical protein